MRHGANARYRGCPTIALKGYALEVTHLVMQRPEKYIEERDLTWNETEECAETKY